MAKILFLISLLCCVYQRAEAQVPKMVYVIPEHPGAFPTDPEGDKSKDHGINAIFEPYGVYSYQKAFKYMKSESLQGWYVIHGVGDADNLATLLVATGKFSDITVAEYAELNSCITPVSLNDSLIANQIINEWYSANWALEAIEATCAWTITTGAGMSVAVVDTEFDTLHEDLNGKLAYVWGQTPTPLQQCVHGTKVAGIVAARNNNQLGIASVGYDLKHNALYL